MTKKEERKKSFKELLAEVEDPKNIGQGSWSLPRNATAAEKTKYEICERILGYQEDNNLSDEVMTRKTHLTQNELEDVLFCRISKFSLDHLMNIASNLFSPAEVKVVMKQKENNLHVRTV